jgi:hypothetical protein
MKYFLLIITLVTSVQHSFAASGLIKSWSPREPQIITFEENPDNPDRVIYKFCLSKQRKKCIQLGDKSEGVRKDILLAEASRSEGMKTFMRYFRPIGTLVSAIGIAYVTIQTGGANLAFLGGSGSVIAMDLINSDSIAPEVYEEMSYYLNSEHNGLYVLEIQDTTIVDFSHVLEKKINQLTKECRETGARRACRHNY